MPLIFERRFGSLYWIQFLAALNDNFLKNGLVILVEYRGLSVLGLAPSAVVALAGAIFILPFFMFSMLAGQIADRFEKTRIVRLVKVWELLIALAATAGFATHGLTLLLLALFMMGCHSTVFGPIKYSALPDLVPAARLVRANALVESGTFLAILLGTIGGGYLINLGGGEFWLSVSIGVCALLGLALSLLLPRLAPPAPDLRLEWRPFALMRQTLKAMRRKSTLYQSVLGISWFWAFGAAILSLLPPYCKEYLHANAEVVTLFLALFTLGIGLGSWLCERFSHGKVDLGLVPFGGLGLLAFLLDFAWVRPGSLTASAPLLSPAALWATSYGPRIMLDFTLMSVAGGFFILPLYTTLQARSDRRARSRVIAGNNVLNALYMVIAGAAVMFAHIYNISLQSTFLILAGAHVLACAHMYFRTPELRLRFRARWRHRSAA